MRSDVAVWEEKYRKALVKPYLIPDPLLTDYADLLKGEGLALDLAAGTCHASVQLAILGRQVIALDCSLTALQIGQRIATQERVCIQGLVADLDEFPLLSATYEVIICLRYLNRKLFPSIEKALKPGGLLLYKTFNRNRLRKDPEFNPKYLLCAGELAQSFPGLELIVCHDGADSAESYSFAIAKSPK